MNPPRGPAPAPRQPLAGVAAYSRSASVNCPPGDEPARRTSGRAPSTPRTVWPPHGFPPFYRRSEVAAAVASIGSRDVDHDKPRLSDVRLVDRVHVQHHAATPARVPPARRRPPRGHPRGRGEQRSSQVPLAGGRGPSPQARGAVGDAVLIRVVGGTIPAGAGSSASSPAGRPMGRDHPCGRGEQATAAVMRRTVEGPSPRERGAGAPDREVRVRVGTIPAGAGSSRGRRLLVWVPGDHPRGRGEQSTSSRKPATVAGPSPRARGAVGRLPGVWVIGGTIPAGAGSRSRRSPRPAKARDHPRGRGEQSTGPKTEEWVAGPSPRARGAAARRRKRPLQGGTIPAGAGSRSTARRCRSAGWDHPRGRGEQTE